MEIRLFEPYVLGNISMICLAFLIPGYKETYPPRLVHRFF